MFRNDSEPNDDIESGCDEENVMIVPHTVERLKELYDEEGDDEDLPEETESEEKSSYNDSLMHLQEKIISYFVDAQYEYIHDDNPLHNLWVCTNKLDVNDMKEIIDLKIQEYGYYSEICELPSSNIESERLWSYYIIYHSTSE